MFCGNCGKKLEDGATKCPDCGTPVPESMRTKPAGSQGQAVPRVPAVRKVERQPEVELLAEEETLEKAVLRKGMSFLAELWW